MRNLITFASVLLCSACSGTAVPAAPTAPASALVRADAAPVVASAAAPYAAVAHDAEIPKLAKPDAAVAPASAAH